MTGESCAVGCGQPAIFDTGRCLQHQRPAPRADRQRDREAGELAVTRTVPGPAMTPDLLAAKADAEAHGFTGDQPTDYFEAVISPDLRGFRRSIARALDMLWQGRS